MALRRSQPVDREAKKPVVILGSGELNSIQQGQLSGLFSLLGLDVEIMPSDEYRARLDALTRSLPINTRPVNDGRFSFADLRSRDDFMVREHLEDFANTLSLKRDFVGRIFHFLVDGEAGAEPVPVFEEKELQYGYGRQLRLPQPPEGIIVKARPELGMPEYTGAPVSKQTKAHFCAHYAVQVGAILEVTDQMDLRGAPLEKPSAMQQNLLLVTDQLRAQVEHS